MINAAQVAEAAGITPGTTTFVLTDTDGSPHTGATVELVLTALQRADLTPTLLSRARIAAMGLRKSFTTGRMNLALANRLRENYGPCEICALVARIANEAGDQATIGYLADEWINDHAADL